MKKSRVPTWCFLSGGFIVALSALIIFVYETFPAGSDMVHCEQQERIVSHNARGDQVALREELCEGIASSATATLSLIAKNTLKKKKFYSATSDAGEPIVNWIGDDILVVRTQKPEEIYTKIDRLGGIQIQYRS